MATTAKDLEGWQIVNVDEEGNVIAEGRSRRSRHSSPVYNTLMKRVEDGLSFGRGDNVIAYDSITKTYSVYLIHEIRTNTLNHVVEIWCFQYLRWFELTGEKYYKQFNPSILEDNLTEDELNEHLFAEIDKNELYLTAELAEIQLNDFIDLAEMVPKAMFESGKAETDKDFVVRYICEPDGVNFVKIDIQKEIRYIKKMPPKQSDDHLKRLSTQTVVKGRHKSSARTVSPVHNQRQGNLTQLESVIVDSNESESEREQSASIPPNSAATLTNTLGSSNGTAKSNATQQAISEKDKAEIEKQKNDLQTLFDDESQRDREEPDFTNYDVPQIPDITGSNGSASLFVNDTSMDHIENTHESEITQDEVTSNEHVAKKRKIDNAASDVSKSPISNAPPTETKSDEQLPTEESTTEKPSESDKTDQPTPKKSLKASTFSLIKNNYNKTLAMLSNLQKSDGTSSEITRAPTLANPPKDVDVLLTLKNNSAHKQSPTAKKTIMRALTEMTDTAPTEVKLNKITNEMETVSEIHTAFTELYYSLYQNISNSTSETYVCYGPNQLGLEYLVHTVIKELQLSSPADGLEIFDYIEVTPDAKCSATNLAIQIWKGLTGELLEGKEALASFLRFAKTLEKKDKKYHIIIVSDLERILSGEQGRKIVAMFEKLVKYPNSKMAIIGVSSKYNNMLQHIPSSETKKKWHTLPIFSYPKKGLSLYTESLFQSIFENTFFVKQDETTKNWTAKNLIVTITTQRELTKEQDIAKEQGYQMLQMSVQPEKIHAIVEYILSKIEHYDDIASRCRRIIFNAKNAYVKNLNSNKVTLSEQPFISLEFVTEIMNSKDESNMAATIRKLPAIGQLVLLTFIHKWTTLILDDNNSISLNEFKRVLQETMQFQRKSGLMKKISHVLCGKEKEDPNIAGMSIIEAINWTTVINKLSNTGFISTNGANASDENAYTITLCCNPLDLREALNHIENFQLP